MEISGLETREKALHIFIATTIKHSGSNLFIYYVDFGHRDYMKLMFKVSHKKSYLTCVEIANFRIIT